MAKLIYTANAVVIREYDLKEGDMSIGRLPDNEIQLDDGTVSGHHARILIRKSTYDDSHVDIYVEDSGSTNGTKVNGRQIKRHLLKHAEVIRVGTHELKFVDEGNLGNERTRLLLSDKDDHEATQ